LRINGWKKDSCDGPALGEERVQGHRNISNNPHVFLRISIKSKGFSQLIKIYLGN